MGSESKVLVLDTSGWLSYYGLGNPLRARLVRMIVDMLRSSGFTLGYTSMTLFEVRKSPRPEIQAMKRDILRFMREHGTLVGPSFDCLIDIV